VEEDLIMADKDYFGDDWVSDSEDFGDSQIEYPEDLLDESFGVDEEAVLEESSGAVLGSVLESQNGDSGNPKNDTSVGSDLTLPKRPNLVKKSVAETSDLDSTPEYKSEPISDNSREVDLASKRDTSDSPTVPSETSSETSTRDPILDAILSGKDDFVSGEIAAEKNEDGIAAYDAMIAEVLAEEKKSNTDSSKSKTRPVGVSKDANVEVLGKDLVDIISAGLDETNLEVDIDFDPDEEDEDSEFDVPLITSEDANSETGDSDDEEYEEESEEDYDSGEDSGGLGYEVSDSNLATANKKLVKSRRRRRPGPKKKRGPKPGLRLTARDVQILTFLARYRVATVGQLARAFETSETALRNRLPRLEKEKLVSWAWGAQSKPKLWLITRQGLQVTNMTLTVPTVKWGQLRHTLGLTDLGIEFELAGELVITEREIRAAATRYTPTSRVKTAIDIMSVIEEMEAEDLDARTQRNLIIPMQGRALGHIPDMILARDAYPNGSSGNIAIELELSRKNATEWIAVLSAYRDSPLFEKVIYYTMNKEIKRALTAIAKAINAEDKVEVEFFVPVDNTADPLITGGK
jgi:hypothetical protein